LTAAERLIDRWVEAPGTVFAVDLDPDGNKPQKEIPRRSRHKGQAQTSLQQTTPVGQPTDDSIQEVYMRINRIVLALTLVLFGTFAAFTPANLHAQTNADIAKNAFEVTVPININNFTYTAVAIPEGKRLVVQNVSLSGAAQTAGAYIQPIVILNATLGTAAANLHYFGPNPSATAPGQYYGVFESTIYADTLSVGPAFAGYTPSFLAFNVVITGYLVDK
jgi:hypothetical protein